MRISLLLILSSLCASCKAAPHQSPSELGAAILAELDSGRTADADDLFRSIAGDPTYTETVYPILYEAAHGRYETGDTASAADTLRFMAAHYPDASAVQEALIFALFIERGRMERPDPSLLDEIDLWLAKRSKGPQPTSVWLDLIRAQQAIDRARLPEATAALARFRSAWTGEPRELQAYLDEITHYVQMHEDQQ